MNTTTTSEATAATVPEDLASKAWAVIERGERCEITEALWDDWLDMLPPAFMGRSVTTTTGEIVHATFGYAEGAGVPVMACWYEIKDGVKRFFAQMTTLRTPG